MSEAFHLVSVPSSSRKGTLKSCLGLVEAFFCVSVSRYHCVLHRKLPFHPIYLHITWKTETLRGQTHPTQLSEVSVPNLFFLGGSHGEMGQCQLSAQLPKQQKPARICTRTLTSGGWERKMTPACSLPTQEQQTSPAKGDIQSAIAFDIPKFHPALFLSNKKAQYPTLLGFFAHK